MLHELSHYKRRDGFLNALLLALQTVYWFNPLTWGLFMLIRQDMELANDAAVLKNMNADEKKQYSLSLVEVLASYGQPTLMPKLLCMVDSEKNIERRIKMIKLGEFFKKRKLIIAIASLLVIGVAGTLFLTVNNATASEPITADIISMVDSTELVRHQGILDEFYSDMDFAVTATKIHGCYSEGDKLRVFVTTNYAYYKIGEQSVVQEGSAGVVPAAITYKKTVYDDDSFSYALENYLEAQDGNRFQPSIEDFCVLPSGKKIRGLSTEIVNYTDYNDLLNLHTQKLNAYLDSHGMAGFIVENSNNPLSTAKRYALESGDKIGKMPEVVLYANGEAKLVAAAISSYLPPPCTYTIENGLLTLYAKIETEQDADFFGFENGDVICTFLVEGGGNTLVFQFGNAALFADEGARYLLIVTPEPSAPSGARESPTIKIEEYYGEASDALELIYEDDHYQYYLSSIRSDKIMLNFENGDRLSLKAALQGKKITIDDLIANGQAMWMYPKNNPLGGHFNIPASRYTFSIGGFLFTPTNSFMYTVEKNDGFESYFAIPELIKHLEVSGHTAQTAGLKAVKYTDIEGVPYANQAALQVAGLSAHIGWDVNSHTPVTFSVDGADGVSFTATVLENTQGHFLVEPENGSAERKSSDKIVVATANAVILNAGGKAISIGDIAVGARVAIAYTGLIAESYPAHITGTQIQVLD
jgi:hypothetical protein